MLERYKEILWRKLSDTEKNMLQAEKKYRSAKAAHAALLIEEELFNKYLEEKRANE